MAFGDRAGRHRGRARRRRRRLPRLDVLHEDPHVAALSGQVPTRAQALVASDMDLIERLTCLRGIGRWTVEMFLLENLQRPDVLPADDFGVCQGYRRLKGLEAAPGAAQLRRIGQAWQPYRSAAAWYLWRVPPE